MPIILIHKPDLEQIEIVSSCRDQNFSKYMKDLNKIIDGFLVKAYKIYIGNIFLANCNSYANKSCKSTKNSKASRRDFEDEYKEDNKVPSDGCFDLTKNHPTQNPSDLLIKLFAFKLLKPVLKKLQKKFPCLQITESKDFYVSFEGKKEDFDKIHK